MNQDSQDPSSQNLIPRSEADLASGQGHLISHQHVEGDVIVTGDIYGSYIAIGRGAQIIVQQALSAAEEAEQRHQLETRLLAQAVADYVNKLRAQIVQAEAGTGQTEPYKSLLPYRLADAPLFFGREHAKHDLLRQLGQGGRGQLMVLHSESGAGKTSLLQAGLAAELLAQGHLPLYVRAWRHSPGLAIKQTLLPDLGRTPELAQLPLRPFLTRVTQVLGLSVVIYILLDQFEEFFVRVAEEETRQEFIEELGACVEDETLPVRFVLSLRKDHFANLSDFRGRIPYIFANEYPLKLFSRIEAASAVTAPAALAGLIYEPGVVDEILTELQGPEGRPIMPAQLQLVCWALYRQLGEQSQPLITRATLQQMGGVAGILRNYLREVISREIPAGRREQAQRVLEALVRSDRSRDVRTVAQLSQELGSTAALLPVLDDLISSRLLRVVEAGSEETVAYELAHDYLVEQIELDPEVLARKAAQELLDQEVEAWQRNPQLRLGEEKLKIIEAQEKKIHFSPAARELYDLSKKARRRRRAILFGLFGTAILLSCIALLLFQSWLLAQENLGIARNALVTATSVIQSAQQEAAVAENRQATAELAAYLAQTAQAEAGVAEAKAVLARQTAEAGQQVALEAEQTALAAGYAAQTRQAEAEWNAATAVVSQATAQAGQVQAVQAQQTAQASQATAQAGQQIALQAQQTAQAQRSAAEESARQAETAAAQARQAQAAAEAARREAEQAQRAAEEAQRRAEAEARQAQRAKEQAEQAAQQAEATRVAVELLRDQAEQELQETERLAAIIRDSQDCPVGTNPGALAFDGAHIWVANKASQTVTKLAATDCTKLADFATTGAPADVVSGGGYVWVAERFYNSVQRIRIADGLTTTFTAGPPASKPTSLLYAGNVLWAASEVTNKVRKIDPATGADLGTYDTGRGPADLVADGRYVWIANTQDNTVSRLEATTGAPAGTFPAGSNPTWLAYDGNHIWVANRTDNTLTKLRASDGARLGTFQTGNFPVALAFDGVDIWAANMDDNTITRLQPVDGTLLSTLPTAKTPAAMLFDGANMWVAAEDADLVQKIPVTINLVGKEPRAMTYDGLYLWVANQADHTVSQMLASTGQRLATVGVGNRPVALVSAGAAVWVAQERDNTVTKLRSADGANLGTFPVGQGPGALAYDGVYIWVANRDGDSVTRLREADGVNMGTVPVGNQPVDLLYDGSHIWVALAGSQSLLKLNPDGSPVLSYDLGISPASLLYDGTYFWVGYTVDAQPDPPETRLRQIRAVDGALVSDTPTGKTGSDPIAPAALAYDGVYLWLSSPNTIGASFVTRLEAANPANLINFPVCNGPSALLYTGSVWVACKDDDLIQKLPDGSGFSASLASLSEAAASQYLPLIVK